MDSTFVTAQEEEGGGYAGQELLELRRAGV